MYISCDVVFDENRYPYADSSFPGIPSLRLNLSFLQHEPVVVNHNTQNYDLTLLLANSPAKAAAPMPTPLAHIIDVATPCMIVIQGSCTPMPGSPWAASSLVGPSVAH
jgi:hypothetical protein